MGAFLGVAAPSKHATQSQRTGKDETTTGDTTDVSMTGGVTGVTGRGGATTGDKCAAATTAGTTPAKTPVAATDDESDYEKWSLCGLDRDEEYKEWEGPQRIRESLLTPEQRKKFTSLLDRIFSDDCAMQGELIPFTYDEVYDVMAAVHPCLNSEPTLIEDLPFDISVVADLNGQLYDLNRIFKSYAKDGKPGWECRKFLFLGDYVHGGLQQLEVIMSLFIIKTLYPDNIFLLRGSHEFVETNMTSRSKSRPSFARELNERYDEVAAQKMYFGINQIFCFLSIGAIIGDVYFCAHAGISPQGSSRDNYRGIYKPISQSNEYPLIHDLVYADPAEHFQGTCMNEDGSHHLGADVLVAALQSIECRILLRGHTPHKKGYHKHENLVISIFSATDIVNKNDAAVADIAPNGHLTVRVFAFSIQRHIYQQKYRELNADRLNLRNDGAGTFVQEE